MSTQGGNDLDAVDADVESALHRLIYLHRGSNLLASPLLRLPTELILKIFAHAIDLDGHNDSEDDDDDDDRHRHRGPPLLILTAICHQLREIGIGSPQLWGTVDLTTPSIAELFLERCKYAPHSLVKTPSPPESVSAYPVKNPRRDAVWEKLGDCAFDRLHSILFEGSQREFTLRVAGVLQRAPNVTNLDICNFWYRPDQALPWPAGTLVPNLSTLYLRKFSISWTSPLLRNLTQLTLDFVPSSSPSEYTSIEMFLTALANCPDLEILTLAHAGPDPLNGHRDSCDTVVKLVRLRGLSLEFRDPSTVGHILSHIGFPESAELGVYVPVGVDTDLSGTMSKILPRQSIQTIPQIRKSKALTVYLGDSPRFFTDNLLVHFQEEDLHLRPRRNSRGFTRFASKIAEVVGGDTITFLNMVARRNPPPDGLWKALLRGLPRLERIRYDLTEEQEDGDLVDSFVFVFSQPFEGGPVCPWLRELELPRIVFAKNTSAMVLKRALTKRAVHGRRLERIRLSSVATGVGDTQVLWPFRNLVKEVQ